MHWPNSPTWSWDFHLISTIKTETLGWKNRGDAFIDRSLPAKTEETPTAADFSNTAGFQIIQQLCFDLALMTDSWIESSPLWLYTHDSGGHCSAVFNRTCDLSAELKVKSGQTTVSLINCYRNTSRSLLFFSPDTWFRSITSFNTSTLAIQMKKEEKKRKEKFIFTAFLFDFLFVITLTNFYLNSSSYV